MENGRKVATPLLLVLAVVELSDVVFAVDSIPAVRIHDSPAHSQLLLYQSSLSLCQVTRLHAYFTTFQPYFMVFQHAFARKI